MSRNKGKSGRRVKSWEQEFDSGQGLNDRTARREKITGRAVKLSAERLAAPQENLELLPKAEGIVLCMFPGGTVVNSGDKVLLCGIAKTFRAPEGATPLAVGDEVTVALAPAAPAGPQASEDKDRADGMVLARKPRRTALSRPQPTSGKRHDVYDESKFVEKVIVANMDVLLIVASTRQPRLRHGLIDRFLIIAERGGLAPVLAINKIDLAEAEAELLSDFQSLGFEVHLCSARTGQGVEELSAAVRNKRSVLAGPSGVGKSTLINALVPGANALTAEVRAKDSRGRHTTSAATIYPLAGGGLIVDTPGTREMGIRMEAAELPWYFPEFDKLSPHCKFRNCSHTHEPNCAVIAAVEAGLVLPRRYEGYLRILETLESDRL